MEPANAFVRPIRKRRLALGLPQAELAMYKGYAAITIYKIESGETKRTRLLN